ncbi:MAG: DUF1501 domain-containing protein [Verrucomicrobiaceae bacterium]
MNTYSNQKNGYDRRVFLKQAFSTGLAGTGIGSLLGPLAEAAGDTSGADGPIFLLIHQEGGNDSLNTVIPHSRPDSDSYYQSRPNLAIAQGDTLELQDGFGLHPSLSSLKGLWDNGELAIINGVGYQSPNLSHFRSNDIWASSNREGNFGSGWLGRYFDHVCAEQDFFDPLVGLETTNRSSLNFRTASGQSAVTMKDNSRFRFHSDANNAPAFPQLDNHFSRALVEKLDSHSTVSTDPALSFARLSMRAAYQSSDQIEDLIQRTQATFPGDNFPDTVLGNDLRNIAQYIAGGSQTSVYFATQSGYDTHSNQFFRNGSGKPLLGTHAGLLGNFDLALGAFADEMKRQGKWNRVLVMSYSEFSRKVVENGNDGTDHGAAGSLFVAGGLVQPGMYGSMPSLLEENLISNYSMASTTDYRQVYRTILEKFMNLSPEDAASILHIDTQQLPTLNFL